MISAVLFIRGIKLLGKPDTARRGNLYSSLGMLLAVIAVLSEKSVVGSGASGYITVACAVAAGSVIGAVWARLVPMTGMPELVALFNGFGGLSSMCVALSQYFLCSGDAFWKSGGFDPFTAATMGLTILIGALAFTGSVVAWGKLAGNAMKKLKYIPCKNAVNAALCLVALAGILMFALARGNAALAAAGIAVVSIASLVLGLTLVIPIGGGDMPVVISLLNALSGLAAAFAGFSLLNTVLVVSGCLVGASGLILTLVMCKAMNKSMAKLLFSAQKKPGAKGAAGVAREPRATNVDDAYLVLEAARSVAIVPGYGMAVAQAQHAVKALADKLERNGAEVTYVIHPVAGRMPGHMNVLLAEANVPYEQLKTADEMTDTLPLVDVAVVIGANDVVNPSAKDDPSSPIYGMPIVNAYDARTVFVLKRGSGTGFSGLENPLFTRDNTLMIYGDAKSTVQQLAAAFD
ncbi:MAG: NAD(P)(+) transhydrogenase (Re/Si-specific) subunit beta [Kiritimatiellae bacterium]|nr:NAD(P)(+) transhydrogenase (Re/Si-specific) subunit beta [Kiritimatiellia bacterium]